MIEFVTFNFSLFCSGHKTKRVGSLLDFIGYLDENDAAFVFCVDREYHLWDDKPYF